MKANVNDKTERLILGNIVELRGNFIPHETEDGVTYECDFYRTRNKNVTFQELYDKERVEEAHKYLTSTDWIYAKCVELGINAIDEYPNVVAKRKAMRELIRELS